MPVSAPIPFVNSNRPISPLVLELREQLWSSFQADYEISLSNFILSCNDALFRYDIFTQIAIAYDMDIYDEYKNEAVTIATRLANSPSQLDRKQIIDVITDVGNEYFDSPRGLHIEDDCIKEIEKAYHTYLTMNQHKDL